MQVMSFWLQKIKKQRVHIVNGELESESDYSLREYKVALEVVSVWIERFDLEIWKW